MPQAEPTAILPEWFGSNLGHAMMRAEQDLFKSMIPDQYYQVGLQLGACDWPTLESINVDVPVMLDSKPISADCPSVLSEPEALPFAEHSIDLVVMPHGLDFCMEPVSTLREINQVLVPEGHLILSGFNRTSLLGCCRFVNKLNPFNKPKPPWNGRFYRVGEIQEWLSLLGLELVGGTMLFYQFPLNSEKWRKRFSWLNSAGDRWWPGFGGIYVLVLKKKVYATTQKAHRHRTRRNWLGILNPAPVNKVHNNEKSHNSH